MKVCIPGGCGYIGSYLIPFLLADGHKVTVLDTQWFGHGNLPDNGSLTLIKGDVRDEDALHQAMEGAKAVIYLAGITNNSMCEENYKLHTDVNCTAFDGVLKAAKQEGIFRFIYASSAACYGSTDKPATEDMTLFPVNHVAQAKIANETALEQSKLSWCIVRLATVCGPSPNMRLDTTVNGLVKDGVNGTVTVEGGEQMRPFVHIFDVCNFFRLSLKAKFGIFYKKKFNLVHENLSIAEVADLVKQATNAEIRIRPAIDGRSYEVSNERAFNIGFQTQKSTALAILDTLSKFQSGQWKEMNKSLMRISIDQPVFYGAAGYEPWGPPA